MWLRSKKPKHVSPWSLAAPLVHWGNGEHWTTREAVENCLVLGGTGSGKSSGSGSAIARTLLGARFGGLVLTAKSDESDRWRRYAAECGRLKDLAVFDVDCALAFNFLDHELQRKGAGAGLTENIVNLFSTVLEIAERNSGQGSGRDDEGYWKRALRQLCRNLVDLMVIGTGRVSVPELHTLLVSAPTSLDEMRSATWRSESLLFQTLQDGDKRPKTPRQERDFALVADYWLIEFPSLSEKTRSIIVSTFTSMVDVLNRGLLRELLCGETTITPEAVEDGKIIVIDLPVKEFGEVGQIAQVIWKYAFQRSIERRVVTEATRPVFLWMDEAQHFVTSYDAQFLATCRSAKVASVLLSQNVSSFYAALGGSEKGRVEADSLFGNLNTKIFHANTDPVTNDWGASIIGRKRQLMGNMNSSQPTDWIGSTMGMSPGAQASAGFSEIYEFEVQPARFTKLRTGGVQYQGEVDAIVVQSGRRFKSTGGIWLPVTFKQQ